MNLLSKLLLVALSVCLLNSCATAQDIVIRRGGGTGTGTVDTNNFGVNGFINYGYTKDSVRVVGTDSYDINTNDTVVAYAGPIGGELQLPDPTLIVGQWVHIINQAPYDLSIVCADRTIIAPDYSGSGTLQIIMPAYRSVTLLAIDTDTWWETASQFSTSWTNGLASGNFLELNGTNVGGYSLSLTNTDSTFHLYSLLTDTSNYRRFAVKKSGNDFVIGSEAAGAGVGNGAVTIMTGGTNRVTVSKDGLMGIGTTAPSQMLELNGGNIKSRDVASGSGNSLGILGSDAPAQNGGNVHVVAGATIGDSGGSRVGGSIYITSGRNTYNAQRTGSIIIKATNAVASCSGGDVSIAAGNGVASGSPVDPGDVSITAGSVSGSATPVGGGNITLITGTGNASSGSRRGYVGVDVAAPTSTLHINGTTTIGTNSTTATVFNPAGSGTNLINGLTTISNLVELTVSGSRGKSVTNTWYSKDESGLLTITNLQIFKEGVLTSWKTNGVEL